MQKKSKQKIYFSQDTEDAIILYNNTSDEHIKNKIYNDKIRYSFDKLVENTIHTYKFYYFDVPYEDVKQEVVSFLIEKIHRYDKINGKAFSFFSVVAKNYLIANNNANYYYRQKKSDVESIDSERNVINEYIKENFNEERHDFIDEFVIFLEKYLNNLFIKKNELEIADAVKDLFKNRSNIENYNKKTLYILIRERTNAKTQQITSVINKIKVYYIKLYSIYTESGTISNITMDDL
jgi:hypothetical protein